MYEINLCCPECCEHKFYLNDDGDWECVECGWKGDAGAMQIRVFDV